MHKYSIECCMCLLRLYNFGKMINENENMRNRMKSTRRDRCENLNVCGETVKVHFLNNFHTWDPTPCRRYMLVFLTSPLHHSPTIPCTIAMRWLQLQNCTSTSNSVSASDRIERNINGKKNVRKYLLPKCVLRFIFSGHFTVWRLTKNMDWGRVVKSSRSRTISYRVVRFGYFSSCALYVSHVDNWLYPFFLYLSLAHMHGIFAVAWVHAQ